jgi:transposase
MQHYVGLDVSLKQTAVCVVDEAGKIRREGMVASEPSAIADFIAANAPQVVRIGFESGATSNWLWSELKKLGLPVICIDARHAKAALKMQINKAIATMPSASPASCSVAGSRKFASKISIAMPSGLF